MVSSIAKFLGFDDKEKELNDKKIIDQSALIQNIKEIKSFLQQGFFTDFKSGPYVNGISFSDDITNENMGTTINKIYNFKEFIESYNKLTPASLSSLVPNIQIWKIYEDGTEFLFPFNNYYPKASIDAITSAGSDRGFQANLVNVEFISQGKDTATMFMYQVKLNLIFDSVQTLFNEKSRYIELFNPPKKSGRYKRGDRDPKYYQIKLKFGWNFNPEIPSSLNPTELKKFADLSGSELFLNYVIHRLTINEDGSVALQIEYIGALEAIARNSNNLTILSSEKLDELDKISKEIETIKENLKNVGLEATISESEDGKIEVKIVDKDGNEQTNRSEKSLLEVAVAKQKEKETTNKNEFMTGIIKNINKQYFDKGLPILQINEDQYLKRKNVLDNFSKVNELERLNKIKELSASSKNKLKNAWINFGDEIPNPNGIEQYLNDLSFQTDPQDPSVFNKIYNIPFFTFGRLLKAIQSLGSKIDKDTNTITESDFIILASDCNISSLGKDGSDDCFLTAKDIENNPEYKIYINNGLSLEQNVAVLNTSITPINILDIPIAFSTFKYWMEKNITSQNITRMSLINFLNLLTNDLLNLALKPTNEDYVPKQHLQFKFFFDKMEFNADNKFYETIKNNQGQKELLNISQLNIQNFFLNEQLKKDTIKKNIIIFYAMPTHNTRKSNFKNDLNDGIPHFFYGQSKGIINKITFREENMPFVREANIQTQVDRKPWKAGVFLRGKYNITIDMIGTVNFRIGSMIYLSPSFPGVISYDDPIEYGIGGYFIIVSLKTNIESGKYTTTIEANWVATGTGEYTDLSHAPINLIRLSKPLEQLRKNDEEKRQRAEATEDYGGFATSGGGA